MMITRKFEFDSGHRVLGHEGKCRHLHGHRYIAEVSVRSRYGEYDQLGRVVDFSVLKERIGSWIDTHWDHNMLLNSDDPLAEKVPDGDVTSSHQFVHHLLIGRIPYLFEGINPTVENMVDRLFEISQRLLNDTDLEVVHVRIYETSNCWAAKWTLLSPS